MFDLVKGLLVKVHDVDPLAFLGKALHAVYESLLIQEEAVRLSYINDQ